MYTPPVYFFARFCSSVMISVFDPLMMSLIVFFGLGFTISFYNYFMFFITALLLHLVGVSMGYLGGVTFDNDQ